MNVSFFPPVWMIWILVVTTPMAVWAADPIPGIGPVGEVIQLQTGLKFTEGPACDSDGNLYFTDIPDNRIYRFDGTGRLSIAVEPSQQLLRREQHHNRPTMGARRRSRHLLNLPQQVLHFGNIQRLVCLNRGATRHERKRTFAKFDMADGLSPLCGRVQKVPDELAAVLLRHYGWHRTQQERFPAEGLKPEPECSELGGVLLRCESFALAKLE